MSHQVSASSPHQNRFFKLGSILLASWFFVLLAAANVFALNLDKLKSHFLQGDYALAITEGERLLAGAPAHEPQLDLLYYFLGLSYLRAENYLRASDIFEIILQEFPDTRLKDEVRLSLADTYFLRGDYDQAKSYYREALNKNANTKYKALIYSRLSQAELKEGYTQTAKEYLDKLKNDFPRAQEIFKQSETCSLPETKKGLYYSVQVGSFSKSANARNLTQKLLKEGYSAYTEEALVAGATRTYRVRVGKLSLLKEAQVLAKELAQKGYPTRICP